MNTPADSNHRPAKTRRRLGFWLALLFLILGAGFAVSEILLRLAGYEPWSFAVRDNEPRVYESDPDLGWKNKPGAYRYPGYTPDVSEIQLTITEDGSRKTEREHRIPTDIRPVIAFVGGSFVQGWAISDYETMAWKLQDEYAEFRFENHGAGGYGTYQSLLVLERILERADPPRAVVYGFIDDHERRNVGTSWWLRAIRRGSVGRDQPVVWLPYCTLDSRGEIKREAPDAYPEIWPPSFISSAVDFFQLQLVTLRTAKRSFQRRDVSTQLIKKMNNLCSEKGVEFYLLFLHFHDEESQKSYVEFAGKEAIPAINCAFELTDELHVDGEGHPNGAMNSLWAECVADALSDKLDSGITGG